MHAVTTAPLPPPPRRATFADSLAEPDDRAAELIHGWLVYKALPSPEHGRAQRKLGALLDVFDGLPGEALRPGGHIDQSALYSLLTGRRSSARPRA